jgi:hypothetical protein
MGCLGVGEAARGEQLIANQRQEWMGIRIMSKRSWFSKKVKRGVESYKREQLSRRGGMAKELLYACISVHMCAITCYL